MASQDSAFSDVGSGFSISSTTSQNVTHPAGITVYTSNSDSSGHTSTSVTILSEPGTYSEIDIDDPTGSPSNTSTWTVTPPLAPFALIFPAKSIQSSGAVFNGTVNPGGESGSVYFNYGTDLNASNLGSIFAGNVTANNTTQPFSVSVGLQASTTYYYQVVFYGSSGTQASVITSFLTLPQTSVTQPASSIRSSSASFNGTVNPNGSVGSVYFNYGTDLNASNLGSLFAGSVTANGLAQNFTVNIPLSSYTTYYYRAVFYGLGGTTIGAVANFTTLNTPTVTKPPTNVLSSSAKLNATVNPNGSAGSVYLNYGTDLNASNLGSLFAGNVSANNITQAFSVNVPLSSATTYYYQAVFYGSGGTAKGAVVAFKTLGTPTATKLPTNVFSSSATLNATVNPNGSTGSVYLNYGTDANASNLGSLFAGNVISNKTVQPFSVYVTLSSSTKYYCQAIFYGAGGTTKGTVVNFTTLGTPTVTQPASNVSGISATLNGTVNPNGATGTVYFNYGTDSNATNLGSLFAGSVTPNSSVQAFSVSASVSPSTKYYYQFVFYGAGGTTTGAIVSFMTP